MKCHRRSADDLQSFSTAHFLDAMKITENVTLQFIQWQSKIQEISVYSHESYTERMYGSLKSFLPSAITKYRHFRKTHRLSCHTEHCQKYFWAWKELIEVSVSFQHFSSQWMMNKHCRRENSQKDFSMQKRMHFSSFVLIKCHCPLFGAIGLSVKVEGYEWSNRVFGIQFSILKVAWFLFTRVT